MGKRNKIAREMEELFDIQKEQSVAKVIEGRGAGQFLVQIPHQDPMLVLLPNKFINLLFIKRGKKRVLMKKGSFLIIEARESSTKIKGDIVCILQKEQIKHLKKTNQW
jgi:probable RNA-binding protein EIF1AD